MTGDLTRAWIRNESDERAAAAGYWFDVDRAAYVVWWIERYCRLYEGEWAGSPLVLRGCHDDDLALPIHTPWDRGGKEESLERARIYAERFAAGEPVDWQYECTMRAFGWVHHSERWDRDVRRFRKTLIGVAKKNKKTPTEAAWGLYLLIGDGEQGQKVFLGAKDGTQAAIAADHAVAMVESSPELSAECKINKNLRRITYLANRSWMQPLSSSDTASQKAKEGLNGSMLVDEIHVVDDAFMQRTKRMGISRSEPMIAQFSTAGMDPDGYGKSQWDYARDVEAGRVEDHAYFAAIYEAPADLTDEQLEADPLKWARMANPAWGHTVHEEEYLADYQESCRKVSDLASFKYQRLNIWQTASNPWKIASRWAACARDIKLADFYGQPCWAGADLSRARDMSAVVFTFRDSTTDPYTFYQFPLCWMVREYAEKHSGKSPFMQWEHDGHLEFCEQTIDLKAIEAAIIEIHKRCKVQEFRHDPAYSLDLAERLEANNGIVSVPFKQTILEYAKPVDDFEAAVTEQTLLHDGHPVYANQIGHANIKSDPNNNRRIIKPDVGDWRKVDIVQAGIMSLSGAMAAPKPPSVYKRRGVLLV
jgi:phage terminase large subunit-like protein